LTLGARNPQVRRLRALLRDRSARDEEGVFVLEGPRVIEGAIERGVVLDGLYLGTGADAAFRALVERIRGAGTPVEALSEGVLEKLGTTRTPQPVLGVARRVTRPLGAVEGSGTVLVAVDVADPGNLGTIIRSAEAAGADAVVACGNSVDAQNPKVVRSSAGAIFGVPVMEADDAVAVLDTLRAQSRRCLATVPAGGTPYEEADLADATAIVVGNEARGLDAPLPVDGEVTVPMSAASESLNVAMAATVLLFEAARQRRARA
jgi:RNA methyltransferase, TrmH family